jgi:DNA mismatch endonuclease Vsr
MRRDARFTLEQTKKLSKARVLGQGRALPIYLEDSELAKLVAVIADDVGSSAVRPHVPTLPASSRGDYYNIPLSWFSEEADVSDFASIYLMCIEAIKDFETYFENLCELHKRRRKYELILSAQPVPTMLQVSPRALLEFGIIATPALASWIMWRKWFYDIDNRAAQETGYLFEPILASALGGVPYGARNSPIKRKSDGNKARQVDCIVGRDAYEFKLRVTIAASGQGRFGEELDFASDCKESGYVPILLVLDPTPSSRLDDLKAAFERFGGRAYIGDEAWQHIEAEAGTTMATFVEKYVRRPIAALDEHSMELLDLYVAAERDQSAFRFRLGSGPGAHEWTMRIRRSRIVERELRAKLDGGRFQGTTPSRSKIMRSITGRNNRTTELRFRLALVRSGMKGWTVRPSNVDGNPDFWFAALKVAVFVDGCFWHGCEICHCVPKSNTAFWSTKFARNRAKDARITEQLSSGGIKVVRFWEHELRDDLKGCVSRLERMLMQRSKPRLRCSSNSRTRAASKIIASTMIG